MFADPLFWGGPNGTVLANVNGPVQSTGLQGPFTPSFNTSAFAPPLPGTFSNQGRGFLRGPGFRNYNLSLFKTFKFADRYKVELRGEAYNITNAAHFGNPQVNVNGSGFGTTTTVGNGLDTLGRQFNAAVRFIF